MSVLYLDTEFNGFGGDLISLALHDPSGGADWYEVAEIPSKPHPFVAEHVLPVLGKEPIDRNLFVASLWGYLLRRPNAIIVADWPEDFAHFSQCLCLEGGRQIAWECEMRLVNSGPYRSAVPHNALEDAKALACSMRERAVALGRVAAQLAAV